MKEQDFRLLRERIERQFPEPGEIRKAYQWASNVSHATYGEQPSETLDILDSKHLPALRLLALAGHFELKENIIQGKDELFKKEESDNEVKYSIRFHIYPGIQAFRTMGGKDILLQISKNNSLIFSVKNQKIQIEKGLFLGRNKILKNNCLVIYGHTQNKDVSIEWGLKKAI